ncbi:YdeI/OmpD-associated family protein [Candidatus Bathyarchaeota archaeon]|nr:YdeI/OmpD-associated family protein [Candidatus Bathyarchaeota archaeon]
MSLNEKLLYVTDRNAWRAWLAEHYGKEKEVWLVFPKKASGEPRIPYNDAVEEALCFGWIDSKAKRVDENSYAQRFSPRKPNSKYSQANKERLKELVRLGKVLPSVQATLGEILNEEFTIPSDILEEIKANKAAWANFQKFSPAYKRIRIAFIEGARNRPAEFRKRLKYFVEMTEKNKQFGFGGIEKYY